MPVAATVRSYETIITGIVSEIPRVTRCKLVTLLISITPTLRV